MRYDIWKLCVAYVELKKNVINGAFFISIRSYPRVEQMTRPPPKEKYLKVTERLYCDERLHNVADSMAYKLP